jgi:hypothetical protein
MDLIDAWSYSCSCRAKRDRHDKRGGLMEIIGVSRANPSYYCGVFRVI